MKLMNTANLAIEGEFQERINRAIHHLLELNTDEMRKEFTAPTDFWHWGADYMGRWISALALLGQYTKEAYPVEAVVQELLNFQNSDGSFGPYTDPHDFQEWFGMGRGLVGLLEYYQVSHDARALAGAKRLGDFYHAHYPDTAPCLYECYSQGLEGIVLLFELTGEEKYLETARRIAATSPVFSGIRYSHEYSAEGRRSPISGQVHCQLSTARGLLDLYEITLEDDYLKPVLDIHEYISKELLWVSGGIGFYYYRPEENETCTDSDWLRLNLQLWRLTGNSRFMDLAEKILLNQLFFNQVDNGGFCYLRGMQNRAGAVFDACCSHHAPRAFYDVLQYIYTAEDHKVWINLFMNGETRLELEGGILAFTSEVREDSRQLTFSLQLVETPPAPLLLQIRIPEWSGQASLILNGQPISINTHAGYAQVERVWNPGDMLVVCFPLTIRVIQGQILGQHTLVPGVAAVFHGPRLMNLNDADNPAVRLHLVKLKLPQKPEDGFIANGPYLLQATGITPDCDAEPLKFTPIAQIGGTPSGEGRIHTVRSPYFKVWIPVDATPL